jgi:hypothetical protein
MHKSKRKGQVIPWEIKFLLVRKILPPLCYANLPEIPLREAQALLVWDLKVF